MAGFKHADIQTLTLDVCSDENVLSVVATILEQEGKIDVVVNNAGVNCAGVFHIRLISTDISNRILPRHHGRCTPGGGAENL